MNERLREYLCEEALTHQARMEAGCVWCHTAVVGRVCPHCYQCRSCGHGCSDCAEARGANPPPEYTRMQP